MNIDKYLKYANYHYPYYDWRIRFDDEYKEVVIRARYTFAGRLGIEDGYQGLIPIYANYSYHDKDIKNLIKKLAKEMKIFVRGKKNASA